MPLLFTVFNKTWLFIIGFTLVLHTHQAWSVDAPTYQRIVSLAPHITEMVYSAGAGDKLVGVIDYSDYPPAAKKLPVVGNYNAINIEAIIKLAPDLIIAWQSGNRAQDIERLKALGFKVWQTQVAELNDIPKLIEAIGQKAGTSDIANKESQRLRTIIHQQSQLYSTKEKVSAFYEIWHRPLMTMNGKQFISKALAVCGAINVFAQLPLLSSEINVESVFHYNPQVIFVGGQQAFQKQWYQDWLKFTRLQAIKNQQIYQLNNDQYQRSTARLIDGLPKLCEKVNQARMRY